MNEDHDVVTALSVVREALGAEYNDMREIAVHRTHAEFSARPAGALSGSQGPPGTEPTVALVVAVGVDGAPVPPAKGLAQAAEITGRVQHPNVMSLQPPRTIAGYWTYERLLSGPTLATLFESSRHESYARVVAILDDVGAALATAHAMNIAHGALRPSCIYVQPDGHCVVDGFTHLIGGPVEPLAFDIDAIPYEAPERRRTGRIDGRADQYALAVIAYELLTGVRRAVRDESGGIEIQALEIPVGRELAKGVPAYAADALRRATARDPNARFETIAAFVETFAGVTRVDQRAPHVMPIAARYTVRSRIGAALLLVGTLLVAALVVAPNETTGAFIRVGHEFQQWWNGIGGDVDMAKLKRRDTPTLGQAATTPTTDAKKTDRRETRPLRPGESPPPSADREQTGTKQGSSRDEQGTTAAPSPSAAPDRRENTRFIASQALASAEPATPDRGLLVVVTDAGHPLVRINRLPRGRAPLTTRLKPGTYTVSLLTRQAYRPKTMQVTVAGGDTAYAEFAAPDNLFPDDTLLSLGLRSTIKSAGMYTSHRTKGAAAGT
ncbi:MAG: serine/threonine protein kinase [Gemmatimonadaceae bacterium]